MLHKVDNPITVWRISWFFLAFNWLMKYIVTIFGICVVESQWKSPLTDRRFITRRNFWNEEALSVAVIYSDAIYNQCSAAESKGNQKHR